MFNSKFNTLLTGLLVVAIIAIIGLMIYFGYSVYNKYYIDSSAKDAVEAFEDAVGQKKPEPQPTEENEIDRNAIGTIPDGNSIYTDNQSSTNTSPTTYYGYEVLGTISIPKLDIKYPVLAKSTTKSLKVAVAYLDGVGINKVGNTIIQGHNYRNGLFFSSINKLSNGDAIYLTDVTGKQLKYEVYKNFQAEATDTSFYSRETNGKAEITLSTCTNDYDIRTIIFAREV